MTIKKEQNEHIIIWEAKGLIMCAAALTLWGLHAVVLCIFTFC
jgi:hypothetical protein